MYIFELHLCHEYKSVKKALAGLHWDSVLVSIKLMSKLFGFTNARISYSVGSESIY